MKESTTSERLTYTFYAKGHPNIRANHFKTLEFTKDTDLSEQGDCIVGVDADFNLEGLQIFQRNEVKKIKLTMKCLDADQKIYEFECKCSVNDSFNDDHEFVLRKSSFNSDRTFGFNLNRGANKIPRDMVKVLQNPETVITVELVEGWY